MVGRGPVHDLESSTGMGCDWKIKENFSMSGSDMASRSLAQQIVVASEVTTQMQSAKFGTMSACDMVAKEPAQGVYCAGEVNLKVI